MRLEDTMKSTRGTVVVLALVMGGWACSAQEATIPFKQLEHNNSQLFASLSVPSNEMTSEYSSSNVSPNITPSDPMMAGFVRVAPATIHRTMGSNFYLLNAAHLGSAVFDVELTHHCIMTHTCREGNPLMPSNLAGALSINFAFVGYSSFISYKLKKRDSHHWWLSPVVGTAAHTFGVATGLAHE
jgi:hypothetical protein